MLYQRFAQKGVAPRMGKPSQNMDDLAQLCRDADWRVHQGARAYICTSPRGQTVNIARLAADSNTYDRARKRLKIAGLDKDLEEKDAVQNSQRTAKLAADRERNDRRMVAAQAKAKQSTVTATVPAAPSVEFSSPDAPAAAISLNQEIPEHLIGVAGLLSLGDDFDYSQIVVNPEDRPKPSRLQVTVYEMIIPERAYELLLRKPGMYDDGRLIDYRFKSPETITKYMGILQRDLLEQKKKAEGKPHHVEWTVAEDIKLSSEPPLNTGGPLNGQHRLNAIVESMIPAIMRVTYNTPASAYDALDQGRRRTDGDILKAKGYKSTTHLASAARLLYAWHQWRSNRTGPYSGWHNWARLKLTSIQLDAFINGDLVKDSKTGESLVLAHQNPGAAMMSYIKSNQAAGIAFRVLVTQAWQDINPDLGAAKLEEFCKILHDGSGPGYGTNHPVHTLRDWLIRGTGSRTRSDKREFILNGMLRAWDYFANSETLGKIIVNEDGPMPEVWAPGVKPLVESSKGRRRK